MTQIKKSGESIRLTCGLVPHEFLNFRSLFVYKKFHSIAGEKVLHLMRTFQIQLHELLFEPGVCDFFSDKFRDVFVFHRFPLLLHSLRLVFARFSGEFIIQVFFSQSEER